jgi:hypothetical protein
MTPSMKGDKHGASVPVQRSQNGDGCYSRGVDEVVNQ